MNTFFTFLIILSQAFTEVFILIKIINKDKIFCGKNILLSFFMFLIQMSISNFFMPGYLRFIFSLVTLFTISHFLFKQKVIDSFVCGLLSLVLISIVEIIFTIILFSIGINQTDVVNNIICKFVLNFSISLFSILIVKLPILNKIINLLKDICIKRNWLMKYILITIVVLYLVLAKNVLFANVTLDMIMNLIILFIAIFLFITIFISDNKNRQLEDINQQMLSYVTKYEKIITEQGKANHEFKNQLMVIRGYAQMNSQKLIEYIDLVVKDTNKAGSSYLISQLNKIPDGGIKGLLYYKLSTMEDENIKYEINVETGIKVKLNSLNTTMYKNITKILGVLIDNAIDASKKSNKKKIIILVEKKNSKVIFNIYNTYKGNIDISKIASGYTTKGKGHGYGLKLVNDIIENTNIFKIENKLEDDYYISRLLINFRKKT